MSEEIKVETGFARINGASIFYRTAGQGPALVMIHAGVADSRMWRSQIAAFSANYTVIACDLRGYGNTAMPEGHFAHYQDLCGLLDYFEIEKAILMGSSLGGATAINCALVAPRRARALVLAAPGLGGYHFRHSGTKRQWHAIDVALASGNYERAAEREIKLWIAGPYRRAAQVDPELRELMRDMLRLMYLTPADYGIEDPLVPAAIDRLNAVAAPVLLINGALDVPDMETIGDLLEDSLPNCKRVIVDDAAHLPNLEKPDEFNRLVQNFLAALA